MDVELPCDQRGRAEALRMMDCVPIRTQEEYNTAQAHLNAFDAESASNSMKRARMILFSAIEQWELRSRLGPKKLTAAVWRVRLSAAAVGAAVMVAILSVTGVASAMLRHNIGPSTEPVEVGFILRATEAFALCLAPAMGLHTGLVLLCLVILAFVYFGLRHFGDSRMSCLALLCLLTNAMLTVVMLALSMYAFSLARFIP